MSLTNIEISCKINIKNFNLLLRKAPVLPMDDCYFGNIMDLIEKKKLVGNTSIYLGLITDAYNPFLNLLKNVSRTQ